MQRYRIICSLQFGDVLKQVLVWLLLPIVTLGIAALFFPYYMIKLVLNSSEIREIQDLTPARR